MKSIKVKPSEFQEGLHKWSKEIKNEFKSYLWLGKAATIGLTPMLRNPGYVIAVLAANKLRGYQRS